MYFVDILKCFLQEIDLKYLSLIRVSIYFFMESAELLQAIIETAIDGIITIDSQGGLKI